MTFRFYPYHSILISLGLVALSLPIALVTRIVEESIGIDSSSTFLSSLLTGLLLGTFLRAAKPESRAALIGAVLFALAINLFLVWRVSILLRENGQTWTADTGFLLLMRTAADFFGAWLGIRISTSRLGKKKTV